MLNDTQRGARVFAVECILSPLRLPFRHIGCGTGFTQQRTRTNNFRVTRARPVLFANA
jgi:hypothetical protein